MCHEEWMRRSEQAVERSWLRALSQRDRVAADDQPREPEVTAALGRDAARGEPVGAAES